MVEFSFLFGGGGEYPLFFFFFNMKKKKGLLGAFIVPTHLNLNLTWCGVHLGNNECTTTRTHNFQTRKCDRSRKFLSSESPFQMIIGEIWTSVYVINTIGANHSFKDWLPKTLTVLTIQTEVDSPISIWVRWLYLLSTAFCQQFNKTASKVQGNYFLCIIPRLFENFKKWSMICVLFGVSTFIFIFLVSNKIQILKYLLFPYFCSPFFLLLIRTPFSLSLSSFKKYIFSRKYI